jgi:hypothetical protein
MFSQARAGIGPFGGSSTGCRSCHSTNLKTLSAEMGIHFPGLKNLDKPVVWVFPSILVCLECGFTEFLIPEEKREEIKRVDAEPARGLGRAG